MQQLSIQQRLQLTIVRRVQLAPDARGLRLKSDSRLMSGLVWPRCSNVAQFATSEASPQRGVESSSSMPNRLRLRDTAAMGLLVSQMRFLTSQPKLDTSVRDLLSSLEMTDYVEKFEAERLTVSDLLNLPTEELRAMVPELGPRTRLLARLTAIRSENPSTSSSGSSPNQHSAAAGSPEERAAAAAPGANKTKLKMPALGDDHESLGTITKWTVQVGDHVKPGKVLCEIETQDAVIEFESPEAGFVTSIIVEAGSKPMRAGTTIATLSNAPPART